MEEQWRKKLFSYESKFNSVGFDAWEWWWERLGEPLPNHVLSKAMKHKEGSIMVWGCMTWEGVGELTKIKGNFFIKNNDPYHNILHDNLSMSVVKFAKEAKEWVFQHCHNQKHTNTSTIKWVNDHTITILPWSPQSPDMNPIEYLWNKVDWCLRLHKDLLTNKDDLWKKL